jgi:hypothetical protein
MSRAATTRLTRRYRKLDGDVITRGLAWYPEAFRQMEALAAETGYLTEQAVAVMAITSRAAHLTNNIRWTEIALRTNGTTPVGRFPNVMTPLVQAVLDNPLAIPVCVSGPKVEQFYRAIMGDEDAVVLDRWALFAAGHGYGKRAPDPGPTWRAIEDAYRRAARIVGVAVRDFQAIIWIAIRESTKTQLGIVPRLSNIV